MALSLFFKFGINSLGIFSIMLLVTINLFWTLRLLHNNKCLQTTTNPKLHTQTVIKNNKSLTDVLTSLSLLEYVQCTRYLANMSANLQAQDVPVEDSKQNNVADVLAFDNINLNLGRWDNQRLYKMHDFALIGSSFVDSSKQSHVCLATQSSVERLYSLTQVASQWRGPISLGVFVAGNEEFAVLQYFVTYMRLCYDFIAHNVTFHLAMPNEFMPTKSVNKPLASSDYRFDCQYPEQTLHRLLNNLRTGDTIRWRLRNEYPQNHMRNLARKGCQSKFVFLTDVDIVPSANMVPLLNDFFNQESCRTSNKLCAYVIPTFEVDIRAKFPASKNELISLTKRGLARPFHEKVFIYNQYATNFSTWLAINETSPAVKISHSVTNFEFLYEPFYVAMDNGPVHNERFLGYGFTRNSQVYEMYVAGYTFHVLSPIFTCHWGLQQKKTRPAWREQQNNLNRKRFESFKSEIFARYKNDPLKMFAPKQNKRMKP